MNIQLREADLQAHEADLQAREAVGARPPWWIHPLRRRAVIVTSLTITAGLAVAVALFWVWYTTMCGGCGASPLWRTYPPPRPIERVDPPKITDRLNPPPNPAPQNR